ncbi:MAG: DUF3857 domain-containing protein [Mucilaginibacter sp.]
MKRIIIFLLLCTPAITGYAQTEPTIEKYGKVSQADLDLKQCDFEKDANAEVLFAKGTLNIEGVGRNQLVVFERHVRIKIFNDFGKNAANVKILFPSYMDEMVATNVQAETINPENGSINITPLDKKLVYTETIDRYHKVVLFTLPNVRAGSIIEYKFRMAGQLLPTWYFQNYLPVRYSEIEASIPAYYNFKVIPYVKQPYVKKVGEESDGYQVRAMSNIHSMPNEPYIGSRVDNLQRISYIGVNTNVSTWLKIGDALIRSDFGDELERGLSGESEIVKKAKSLKSEDDKIAFVFDTVKRSIQWNKFLQFYPVDGTVKVWDKKIGSSAEINMIVYHLLKKVGIEAYPLVVSTKANGKINPADPNIGIFNNTDVYVPVDSTKVYVLDASNKFNLYNTIPANVLNTFGLCVDPHRSLTIDITNQHKLIFIASDDPGMQSVYLNAEIKSDGKMTGDVEITSSGYEKVSALNNYYNDGELKYIDTLRNNDNNLKISSFKRDNVEQDSLPLSQKFNFDDELNTDGNYIYYNANPFNLIGKNPFYSTERFSDVDFGYRDNFSLFGVYKLPQGYKADALPKSITITMPDQSIIFKRTVAEDNGTVLIKYVLNHRKTIHFKSEYPDLQAFYKKMYELLNEQVVVKKA